MVSCLQHIQNQPYLISILREDFARPLTADTIVIVSTARLLSSSPIPEPLQAERGDMFLYCRRESMHRPGAEDDVGCHAQHSDLQ